MKDIGLTHPKGMNYPCNPKAGPSAAGPKPTNGGVSLEKGYNKGADYSNTPNGPHSETPND